MNTLILTLMFNAASQQFGLPQNLLQALCYVESKQDINAVHRDDGGSDSLGVCQIKYETAKDIGFRGTVKDLMKPKNNIYYAAKFLSKQKRRYHGNITKAVVAYNRGNADHHPSSAYSDKVLKQWRKLNAHSSPSSQRSNKPKKHKCHRDRCEARSEQTGSFALKPDSPYEDC